LQLDFTLSPAKLLGAAVAVLAVTVVSLSGSGQTVRAAALCVNAGGTAGCLSTIQAAVNAASPGDTITVAAGAYPESVTISTPLTLEGAGAASATIDARGADNAVHITADHVTLRGFMITGARLDGVLVNGNYAEILNNHITGNATLVVPPPPGAPPVPSAWNGLNLQNASYALVADNDVSDNVGRGIRLEGSAVYTFPDQGINLTVMGRSDHNVIAGNTVRNNKSACGIVLSTDSSNNIVANNTSTNNPAGIVVSALPPFGLPNTPFADHAPHSDGNIISNNTVQSNLGLGINIDAVSGTDNGSVVMGNTVSGNGPSGESSGKTVGIQVNGKEGTQVDGTLVVGNTVTSQDLAEWIVPDSSVTNVRGIEQ
jgi:parallel beta-helix repeat protein